MSNFFDTLRKSSKNEYATKVEDGIPSGDLVDTIDSGSYVINALVSGSLFGGFPSNKVTVLAGEQATGKTYFLMGMVKEFLDKNKEAGVMYFESESAITKEMFTERGIDTNRVHILPVATVEEFRTQAVRILDKYLETDKDKRPQLMMCLDSLGMLSTTKEVDDIADGSDKKDMTRAQLIKGAFRVLTLKLGVANVSLFVTNHTYQGMGMYDPKRMSGGLGPYFSASNILFLTKAKETEGSEVVGGIITCKNEKARFTKEKMTYKTRILFESGLDRYYGLLGLSEELGLVKRVGNRYEFPDGEKYFRKEIDTKPEKYFTKEFLEKLDKKVPQKFKYGVDTSESKD